MSVLNRSNVLNIIYVAANSADDERSSEKSLEIIDSFLLHGELYKADYSLLFALLDYSKDQFENFRAI